MFVQLVSQAAFNLNFASARTPLHDPLAKSGIIHVGRALSLCYNLKMRTARLVHWQLEAVATQAQAFKLNFKF